MPFALVRHGIPIPSSLSTSCLCLQSGGTTLTSWMEPVEWTDEPRLSECSRSSAEESEVVVKRVAYPRYNDGDLATHDSFARCEDMGKHRYDSRQAQIVSLGELESLEEAVPSDEEDRPYPRASPRQALLQTAGLVLTSCSGRPVEREDLTQELAPHVLMIPCMAHKAASSSKCCAVSVTTPCTFEWQATSVIDEELVSNMSEDVETHLDILVDSPRAENVVHVEPFSIGDPTPNDVLRPLAKPGTPRVNQCLSERSPVILHVYDISFMSRLAGVPLFHFGVEVHDKEYAFGECGISCCRPGGNTRHIHREAVRVGFTSLTKEQVVGLRKALKKDWQGNTYSPLIKNCQSFAAVFCGALEVAKGPDCIPERFCKLPEPTSAVAQASDTLFGIYTAMPKCDMKGSLNRAPCGVISNCGFASGNALADGRGSSRKKKKGKNGDSTKGEQPTPSISEI